MSGWDWLPVALAAWFALSVVVALIIGPVLRQCSEGLEAADLATQARTDASLDMGTQP